MSFVHRSPFGLDVAPGMGGNARDQYRNIMGRDCYLTFLNSILLRTSSRIFVTMPRVARDCHRSVARRPPCLCLTVRAQTAHPTPDDIFLGWPAQVKFVEPSYA